MTDKNILKLKLIQAAIEAIDLEDAKDAQQAMEIIRALLGADKQS
jgi:hypothetical protein